MNKTGFARLLRRHVGVVESYHDFRTSGGCSYGFWRTLHDGERGLHRMDHASMASEALNH